ncbi:FAD-binding oxidoreductase [Micromonospora olivasterospora]|uniref:Flavin-dependent oxidoreductase n=1 Tax=Micromonospora olivasterospora TaxID=1880 RepID=A0A562IIY1_MICOL|nr:FAD-binding oxidoreductase [Micromonospora olivasterospora]TWH70685.1 flavin-dependent oxidoreductase [Micromonospora olivasterospora]
MTDPAQSLAGALAAHDRAADHFWSFTEDRSVRLRPSQVAPIFFSTLGHLVAGKDAPAGRRAGIAVLGRMYRRFGLYPYHGTVIAAAMADTVRRFAGGCWEPELAGIWGRGCRRVLRLAERAAGVVGDGPHVTAGVVEACEAAADGVAVLTVRPTRRLRYAPGQAMPVCTPRLPGAWRWYSPANAPRRDGRVEFHARAVAAGEVSRVLVERVAPGELLWLGPAFDVEPDAKGDLLGVALDRYRPGQAVYVCGPPRLIESARSLLPAAGVTPDRLHLAATFADAPGAALWASGQRPSPAGDPFPTMTAASSDVRSPRSAT